MILLYLLFALAKTEEAPIIQTNNGLVQGEFLKTVRQDIKYTAFRGIPYGEPPIGYRRFKPPVEKANWSNVRDATHDANPCIHYDLLDSKIIGSEDCLYLNVYTPHTNFTQIKQNNQKAVMFWIFGGAFSFGVSSLNMYGPDFLIENDVIIVTFNHRLGALGFLNLNHENATGNAGLKDQNLALRWVKKNIVNFGGDPDRITIFGLSSGAVSVDLHVLSEMSKGLFSRSIAMSGSPLCLYWGMQSREEARLQAFILGSKLGINTLSTETLLERLSEATAEEIVSKTKEMTLLSFRTTIENPELGRPQEKFITKCPVELYKTGKFNKAPHMLGFTSNEAKGILSDDVLELAKHGESLLPIAVLSLIEKIVDLSSLSSLSKEALEDLAKLASQLFFETGIDSTQKLMLKHNGHPIYYYRYSFENAPYVGVNTINKRYNVHGVGHAEDMAYLFYISYGGMPLNDSRVQRTVNRYTKLFTNFAKYGNPTPNGTEDPLLDIIWPDSGAVGWHLDINDDLTVGFRPTSTLSKFYELNKLEYSRILDGCF